MTRPKDDIIDSPQCSTHKQTIFSEKRRKTEFCLPRFVAARLQCYCMQQIDATGARPLPCLRSSPRYLRLPVRAHFFVSVVSPSSTQSLAKAQRERDKQTHTHTQRGEQKGNAVQFREHAIAELCSLKGTLAVKQFGNSVFFLGTPAVISCSDPIFPVFFFGGHFFCFR
jgi:hypothetical protein